MHRGDWGKDWGVNLREKGERRREKREGRKEKGEGRREKREGRKEKGEGRREKREGRKEKGEGRRKKREGRRKTEEYPLQILKGCLAKRDGVVYINITSQTSPL
ncbi:MAG: hypothetical protein FWD09_00100 [Lentimicrobiaceae bacterium]|nr:hypothetical protein [Lentimicrobiaceae bacterium]